MLDSFFPSRSGFCPPEVILGANFEIKDVYPVKQKGNQVKQKGTTMPPLVVDVVKQKGNQVKTFERKVGRKSLSFRLHFWQAYRNKGMGI